MKKKTFVLAAISTIIQYYDYAIFGLLAASISKYFFPAGDGLSQLIKTYLIMMAGVSAKPVGALILGRIGDLYGRSKTLNISLLGTAIGSLIISLTPSYEKIGILSAIILLLCRMCVCAFVSSGTDGVRIYIFEHIGKKKQCFGNGLVTMATQMGAYLASLSAWFFTLENMPPHLWRIAFLIGSLMGIIMVSIRKYFDSDIDYCELSKKSEYEYYKNISIWNIIKPISKLFTLCLILGGCIGSVYQFNIIYFGTYIFEILKLENRSVMQLYTSVAILIYMSFSVIAGLMADHFGKRITSLIASLSCLLIIVLHTIFIMNNKFVPLFYFLTTALLPGVTMPALAIIKESIPVVIRYRIFSFAHAIGSILISGTTNIISTKLYQITLKSWVPMIYFLGINCVMIVLIQLLIKNSKIQDLSNY